MTTNLRSLAAGGLLFLSCSSAATAQDGFFGFGGEQQTPSLSLAPAEIQLKIPLPVNGTDLNLLLAQAGSGPSLSAMRDAALSGYREHLSRELSNGLREFFADEEVPLVAGGAALTLLSSSRITVIKQLGALENKGGYDIERGTVELSGKITFELRDFSGRSLLSRELDVSDFKTQEKYLVQSGKAGSASKDTTDAAIKRALSELARGALRKVDDDLEADELRELLAEAS